MPASEYKCHETVKAGEQQKFVLHLNLKIFAKSEENFYWCIQIKLALCTFSSNTVCIPFFVLCESVPKDTGTPFLKS